MKGTADVINSIHMATMRLPRMKVSVYPFDAKWVEMKSGLMAVLKFEQKDIKGMDLYSIVYTICTSHKQLIPKLYDHLTEFFVEFTQMVAKELTNPNSQLDSGSEGLTLLQRYAFTWNRYNISSTIVSQIFEYMKQHQSTKIFDILPLMLQTWKTHISYAIHETLIEEIMNEITEQRKQKSLTTPTSADVQGTIQSYIYLGIDNQGESEYYKKQFELPFLAHLDLFYETFSAVSVESSSIVEYAQEVEFYIRFEEQFCTQFLSGNSEMEVLQLCNRRLVGNHLERFFPVFKEILYQNESDSKNVVDLKRIYSLTISFPQSIIQYSTCIKDWVTDRLNKTRQDNLGNQTSLSSACIISLVSDILSVYVETRKVVAECLEKHNSIMFQLEEGFTDFINRDINRFKMSEIFAMFADLVLRGKLKISEKEKEEMLDHLISVFSYMREKDLFHQLYKRNFARRLLSPSSLNEDLERGMLCNIKSRCGAQFTAELERMFQDLLTSEGINESYRQETTPPVCNTSFSVQILSGADWPKFETVDTFKIHENLQSFVTSFEHFYCNSQNKRKKLQWLFQHGGASVIISRKKGKPMRWEMTLLQASLLLLFNDQDTWEVKELALVLNVKDFLLRSALQRLISGKTNLLISDTKAVDSSFLTTTPSSISINNAISSKWPTRKSICVEYASSLEADTMKSREDVGRDRSHQVDAAIVRAMKSRRTMEFQELIAELISILAKYFKPDITLIKTRIETMLEREFLVRDAKNSSIFHYQS